MIQSVSFTSAAFEAFAEAYLCFLVSASAKKNAEVIKFLGILKIMSPRIKYFCSRKKSNVSINKKVIFVFHTIFQRYSSHLQVLILHRVAPINIFPP